MKIDNNSDSVVIVLHEIYGINQHMKMVCNRFSESGYDIICPNLIGKAQPFSYAAQEEAYQYFMSNLGFESAARHVKQIIIQAKKEYRHVFVIGYSIGATIAWLCSSENDMCDGFIGYYGSRIRDYMDIIPKCPVLLIFASEEKSFDVKELVESLKKRDIDVHILNGKHGFGDPLSNNYCEYSFKEAAALTDNFLRNIRYGY